MGLSASPLEEREKEMKMAIQSNHELVLKDENGLPFSKIRKNMITTYIQADNMTTRTAPEVLPSPYIMDIVTMESDGVIYKQNG